MAVGRAAAWLAGAGVGPGRAVRWRAVPEAAYAVDLALLHLGAVAEAVDEAADVDVDAAAWTDMTALRDEPARLVRLRADLRPTDRAAVRGARPLDHAAVLRHARRAAHALQGAREVAVSASPALRQSVGWGAVLGGYGLLVGEGPDLLSVGGPDAWVCTPEALVGLALPRSRLGPLGSAARSLSAAAAGALGPGLRRVLVQGTVPPEAAALRQRGVSVTSWIEDVA